MAENFKPLFTRLCYICIYTKLYNYIQLSLTLTQLSLTVSVVASMVEAMVTHLSYCWALVIFSHSRPRDKISPSVGHSV